MSLECKRVHSEACDSTEDFSSLFVFLSLDIGLCLRLRLDLAAPEFHHSTPHDSSGESALPFSISSLCAKHSTLILTQFAFVPFFHAVINKVNLTIQLT